MPFKTNAPFCHVLLLLPLLLTTLLLSFVSAIIVFIIIYARQRQSEPLSMNVAWLTNLTITYLSKQKEIHHSCYCSTRNTEVYCIKIPKPTLYGLIQTNDVCIPFSLNNSAVRGQITLWIAYFYALTVLLLISIYRYSISLLYGICNVFESVSLTLVSTSGDSWKILMAVLAR